MSLLFFLACSMSASTPAASSVAGEEGTAKLDAASPATPPAAPPMIAEATEAAPSTSSVADVVPTPATIAAPAKAKRAPAEPEIAAPAPPADDGAYARAEYDEVVAGGVGLAEPGGTATTRRDAAMTRDASRDRGGATREEARSTYTAPVTPLRAGATDDNADYDAYLTFLGSWTDRGGMRGRYQPLHVSGRKQLLVLDAHGRPVPGAEVTVQASSGTLLASRDQGLRGGAAWTGTTFGDGRTAFYPGLSDSPGASDWTVTVTADGAVTRAAWNGSDDLTVRLPRAHAAPQAVPVDVVFVVDTTGSMGDEIARIKDTLLATTARIRGLDTPVDLRYGAVYYRDHSDTYVTRSAPLSRDIQGFDRQLHGIDAGGGGDYPEALNEGLRAAVTGMDWRPDAAKVAFLIADAPPHMDYQQDIPYGDTAEDALRAGIRVHTVAASGLDEIGTLAFRQIAQLSRGQFIFIEYGGGAAATAASHGVGGQFETNNLDQILYGRIRDEVVAYGR